MKTTVREMGASDRAVWAEIRGSLWPDDSLEMHLREIDEMLVAIDAWGFIAEFVDGVAAGFAELALRKYANGCTTRPVPFLEGIWVKAEFRRQGIGARLVKYAGAFAIARGFLEMGSDAEIDNRISHAAHLGWGFSETERVVYFRKALSPLIRQGSEGATASRA